MFANATQRNSSLPGYLALARREAALEQALQWLKLNASESSDHVLDALWRWQAMGGAEWVGMLPAPVRCDAVPAGQCVAACTDQECCKDAGLVNNPTSVHARMWLDGWHVPSLLI